MKLTHTEKLGLLSQLIKLASADGSYADEEYDLLHNVAQQLKVEPIDMELLFTNPHERLFPKAESTRITVFYELLKMTWSDGEMNTDEIALLKDLGMKLGLPMQAIDAVIHASSLYSLGNMPFEEAEGIFKVHHN